MNKYCKKTDGENSQSAANKKNKFVRINWNIRSFRCRVIEDGKPPKIMQTKDAVEYATGLGLDLIEIGYDKQNGCSNCKIGDYGKFAYEQKRREKMAKKQARAAKTEVKCIQMSLTTDVADLERIIAKGREFLEEGDNVKLSLRFKNRHETTNMELAKKTLKNVVSRFEDLATVDSEPQLNGRELSCVLKRTTKNKTT